jgi:hypothetical protein
MKRTKCVIIVLFIFTLACSEMGGGREGPTSVSDTRAASVAMDGDPVRQAQWARLEAASVGGVVQGKTYRILNTSVDMVVKSFHESLASVKKIVDESEGQVASTESHRDDDGHTSGTVEVKIPADRYEKALKKIQQLGEVRSMNEKSEDVTKEFVDLQARLGNARALEKRILTLLETHTGKIEDVLNVEKELASVREKIEELEGQKRYLENRIQFCTITVHMAEKGAAWGGEITAKEILKQVIGKIGIVFVGSLGILIVAVVGAVPWAVALALLAVVIREIIRRRKKAKPAA